LPIGGFFIALFVGWFLSKSIEEKELGHHKLFNVWHFVIRYVTPVAVLIIFLNKVGIIG